MSQSFHDAKKWNLPEFPLMTHVQHKTEKKLKAKSKSVQTNMDNASQGEYQAGYLKGVQDAQSKIQHEMNLLRNQMTQLFSQISPNTSASASLNERYRELIWSICNTMIKNELHINQETIYSFLEKASELIAAETYTVKFGKAIYQKLNEVTLNKLFEEKKITVELDAKLSDYDFKIESANQNMALNIDKIVESMIDDAYQSWDNQ